MDEQKLEQLLTKHAESVRGKDNEILLAIGDVKNDTNLLKLNMEQIQEDVQKHEKFINGPPAPGAKIGLDRLTQSSKFQKRGLWIVAAAAIGSFFKSIVEYFSSS